MTPLRPTEDHLRPRQRPALERRARRSGRSHNRPLLTARQRVEDDGVIVGSTALLDPVRWARVRGRAQRRPRPQRPRHRRALRRRGSPRSLDELIGVRRMLGLPDYVVRVGTLDLTLEVFVTAGFGAVAGSEDRLASDDEDGQFARAPPDTKKARAPSEPCHPTDRRLRRGRWRTPTAFATGAPPAANRRSHPDGGRETGAARATMAERGTSPRQEIP